MSQATAGNKGTADASTQTKITGENPKTTLEEAIMEYLRDKRRRIIRERQREMNRLTANFRRQHGGQRIHFDSFED